jgi:hypothetical protein
MLVPVAAGVWRSLVARFVRDEEAVGSNPATPTNGYLGRLTRTREPPRVKSTGLDSFRQLSLGAFYASLADRGMRRPRLLTARVIGGGNTHLSGRVRRSHSHRRRSPESCFRKERVSDPLCRLPALRGIAPYARPLRLI